MPPPRARSGRASRSLTEPPGGGLRARLAELPAPAGGAPESFSGREVWLRFDLSGAGLDRVLASAGLLLEPAAAEGGAEAPPGEPPLRRLRFLDAGGSLR